ncbi:MAG: hypothetical protein QXT14_08420 [Candidatus Bathyarchaeia archaeon]
MALRTFEREIITRWIAGGTAVVSPTGEWIKNHLLDVGEDYTYSMWRRYQIFVEIARSIYSAWIKSARYLSFARYVCLLKRLGLIEPSRREKGKPRPRTYYRVVIERVDSPDWAHPYQALYPVTSTSHRRRIGLPVKYRALVRERRPRGRPRKR